MLYEKYNPNDIFKKKDENITENSIEQEKNMQMIESKESFIRKLISKIKKVFFR